MEEKICSFFGHRDIDITDRLYTITYAEIMRAVELGCRTFYFGGYGAFMMHAGIFKGKPS